MQKLPDHIEQEAIRLYQDGNSGEKVAAILGIGRQSVTRIFRRNCVSFRKMGITNRQYVANHAFFDSISTEQQAYVLGIWATDGCVTDRNCVSLLLKASDISLIEKIREAMGSTHPIKTRLRCTRGKQVCAATLSISSPQLASGLFSAGITPRKSFSVRPWKGPEWLMPHYWRGCVDGDGYVSEIQGQYGKPYYRIGFCGNEFMVGGFRDFVRERIGADARVVPTGSIFCVRYNGLQLPQKIARILYGGSTIWLDRKKRIIDRCLARSGKGHLSLEINGQLGSVSEWAQRSGIKRDTIAARYRLGCRGQDLIRPVSMA